LGLQVPEQGGWINEIFESLYPMKDRESMRKVTKRVVVIFSPQAGVTDCINGISNIQIAKRARRKAIAAPINFFMVDHLLT